MNPTRKNALSEPSLDTSLGLENIPGKSYHEGGKKTKGHAPERTSARRPVGKPKEGPRS